MGTTRGAWWWRSTCTCGCGWSAGPELGCWALVLATVERQIWSLEDNGGLRASPAAGQFEIRLGSLVRLCSFSFLAKFVLSGAWGKVAICSNLVWTFFPFDFMNYQGYPCSYGVLRIV